MIRSTPGDSTKPGGGPLAGMYPAGYSTSPLDPQDRVFAEWLDGLRDLRARPKVQVRIERLAAGNREMFNL